MVKPNNGLVHIGNIEKVDFPELSIFGVPAKIDTGADGSAIWASNIRLKASQLWFNFFAPGNVNYSEQPVVTTVFRTTSVRNSFGQQEFRYKIRLKVQIGNQVLKRWFTLADRSRNNYPILLGRNFLKNNFIVDVSQKHLVTRAPDTGRVLVFTDYPQELEVFFQQAHIHNKLAMDYVCAPYAALLYSINGASSQVINTLSGEDIAGYSFVYFKNHHNRELSVSAAEYLHYKNRAFADQEFSKYMSASKLSEYMRLSNYGLCVPPTICAVTAVLKERYRLIAEQLKVPFILKEIRSDKGKYNYLVRSEEGFTSILDEAPAEHIYCAQQYIPNDGFYRLYVMGKDVALAIWRSTTLHDDERKVHLNKPRGSANASLRVLDEVPGEAQDLALRAAGCMDRQICGVDVLQDNHSGQWYVLEANNDPQIRTGSFVAAKAEMIAKYFDRELNQ